MCFDGFCVCNEGYFNDPAKGVFDCSISLLSPPYKIQLDLVRGFCAALYCILTIVALIGAYYGVNISKYQSSTNVDEGSTTSTMVAPTSQPAAPAINIRRIVLLAVAVLAIFQVVYLSTDPLGLKGVVSGTANWEVEGTDFYIGIFVYTSILFHWVDIYYTSLTSIRTENMLRTINTNYKGTHVTVEQVVQKVVFLKKLKIPFLVVVLSVMIFQIVAGFYFAAILPFIYYSTVVWIVLMAGFVIYGRRLVSLMPPELFQRVRKLTLRVTILSVIKVLSLLSYIIGSWASASSIPTPASTMAWSFTVSYFIFVECSAMIMVFAQPNKKWPFLFMADYSGKTSSGSV